MKKLYMFVVLMMALAGTQASVAADVQAPKSQSASDQPFKSDEVNFVVDRNGNGIEDDEEDRSLEGDYPEDDPS